MQSRYVVIGAGLAGSATAWRLAQRGVEVTLLERTRPAARDGSSHGSARIFRYAYSTVFYADLVVQSRALYDELARATGRDLIERTGSIDFGVDRDPRALAAVLTQVGVEHEVLSEREAAERFPQVAPHSEVLWHPAAGVLDPEATVQAAVDQTVAYGGRVLSDWPVERVEATTTGYRVHGQRGDVDAERVVIAVGAWLPALLPQLPLDEGFRALLPPLEITQENVYHFPYRDESAWPTFIHNLPGLLTYGLPGGRDGGFRGQKVAEFLGGRRLASAVVQDGRIDPGNRAKVIDYVTRYLPGLVPEPYAETTCLFTNTPTEDFLLDRSGGITLVSACSGHGAKFGPLTGEIAAAVATGEREPPEPFRVGRTGSAGRPSSQ